MQFLVFPNELWFDQLEYCKKVLKKNGVALIDEG
jgi:hypothetical protein